MITGSGFQPSTSAISILIYPNTGAPNACGSPVGRASPRILPVAVPVGDATSTTLEIAVPALINAANGTFTSAAVKVQVVQISATSVETSKQLTGLCILEIPTVPPNVTAGAITHTFATIQADALQDMLSAPGAARPGFKTKLRLLRTKLQQFASQVATIVKNPNRILSIPSTDNNPFILDANMLARSDRLIAAYLLQIVPVLEALLPATTRATRTLDQTQCNFLFGNGGMIDEFACRQRSINKNTPKAGRDGFRLASKTILTVSLGVLAGLVMLAFQAVLAPFEVAALIVFFAFAIPSVVNYAVQEPAPPLDKGFENIVLNIVDSLTAGGLSVFSSLKSAADLYEDASKIQDEASSFPKRGVALSGSNSNAPAGRQVVTRFQKTGASTTTTKVSVPTAQATVPIADVTLGPEDVRRFDGTYTGTFSGSASGSVQFTVSNAAIRVISPGAGSGVINTQGRVVVGNVLGNCTFGGSLTLAAQSKRVLAGGGWECPSEDDVGRWSAVR